MGIFIVQVLIIITLWPLFSGKARMNNKVYNGKNLYLAIVFIILGIPMALRAYSVGTDTLVYCRIQDKIAASSSFQEALQQSTIRTSPVYVFYSYVLGKIFRNHQIILIVNAIIICVGFYLFVKRTSHNYLYSIILFIILTMYYQSMNGMRQFVSIAIGLNAILLLQDNINSIKGWILYCLSILIHVTSLIFLLTIISSFLLKRKNGKGKKYFTAKSLVLSILVMGGFEVIIQLVVRFVPTMAQYVNGKNNAQIFANDGKGRIVILYLALAVVIILFARKIKQIQCLSEGSFMLAIFPSVLFCVVSGIIFCRNILFNRLLWPLLCLFIPFIPNTLDLYKVKNRKIYSWGIVSVLVVYCIFHMLEDKSGIIPYVFFWNA